MNVENQTLNIYHLFLYRMYAHSVRCLEESLPNCKRGEVVPFLDFFLEYARLNGTERDYQCGGTH